LVSTRQAGCGIARQRAAAGNASGNPGNLEDKAYLTLGLGYNLFNSANGFRVDVFGGPKGFNVADGFKFQSGKGSWVFGVGFSIPLGN
jgi:hypothetical protein